jgi:prolyl-tRNA editing enzyme YbaK/EbsC (Cys-tRNA(Pro) deacylase)
VVLHGEDRYGRQHRRVLTSVDEARALGIEVGEVLKTLAVRTGSGYALVVIPASRRLDLHLAREALGDNRARLASEEELGRDFPDYELGALPPLGALLDAPVYVDLECWAATIRSVGGAQPSKPWQAAKSQRRDGFFGTVPAAGAALSSVSWPAQNELVRPLTQGPWRPPGGRRNGSRGSAVGGGAGR